MSQDVLCCLFGSAGFDRGAQGIVGTGQRLAAETGGKLHVLVLGSNAELTDALTALADVIHSTAGEAFSSYQPELAIQTIADLGKQIASHSVLLGNDAYSQELAPRIAHRLGGSAVGDAADVSIADGAVHVHRSVYGGKAVASIKLKRSPAVVWLRARAMPVAATRSTAAELRTVRAPTGDAPSRLLERQTEAQAGVRLEDAQVIVSGGRGLGGPEPFDELRKLAGVMKAELAASRAACDAGWVPPTWQVGQTGKKVAPTLYLAVAISGASQHLLGISDAQVIAAINTDAEAPIFKHCQFGIVEDYRKVIGPLCELLAKRNG